MTTFATPSTPSGVNLNELDGALLIIDPVKEEPEIPTVHGVVAAIRCHITVVDGPNKGAVHRDTLIFPKVLVSTLRNSLARPGEEQPKVLGRLGRGTAKPGQSAPWVLTPGTEADIKLAEAAAAKAADDEEPF